MFMLARVFSGKRGSVGLACAVMLAAGVAGCGGAPTDSSDVNVVLPEPGVNVSSSKAAAPGAAPGALLRRHRPLRRPRRRRGRPLLLRGGERSKGGLCWTGRRRLR